MQWYKTAVVVVGKRTFAFTLTFRNASRSKDIFGCCPLAATDCFSHPFVQSTAYVFTLSPQCASSHCVALTVHSCIHSFIRSFVRSFMTHCQLATFKRANGLSPWLTLPHELQLSVHICFYDVFMRLFRIHGVTLSLTVCGSFPRRYYRLTDGRLNDILWLMWPQFYCTLTALSGSLSSIIANDAIW